MKLSPVELANEIFMSTTFSAHLIVEGDSDYALIRQHVVDKKTINILPAHGSENVLQCMLQFIKTIEQNNSLAKTKAHFFIDADYRSQFGKLPLNALLTTTTLKDIECEMIESHAFEIVATEFICPTKLLTANKDISDHRKLLIESATILGALRYFSEKENLQISFIDMNPKKFLDPKKICIDIEKLAAHLSGKNHGIVINKQIIKNAIEDASTVDHFKNPLNLCSGHDLTLLFSSVIKDFWKKRSHPASCEHPDIEIALRLSFVEYFKRTQSYKSIYSWFTLSTGNMLGLASPI